MVSIHIRELIAAIIIPTVLQERIFAGLYAYGLKPHPEVRPAPSSIHAYLERSTREMFDRAFQQSGSRPSAQDWRDHLRDLIQNKTLVPCAAQPSDHAHFSKGCGLCSLEKKRRTAAARSKNPQSPRKVHTPQWSGKVLSRVPPKPTILPWIARYSWVIIIGLLAIYHNLVQPTHHDSSPPPASSKTDKDTSRLPQPYS